MSTEIKNKGLNGTDEVIVTDFVDSQNAENAQDTGAETAIDAVIDPSTVESSNTTQPAPLTVKALQYYPVEKQQEIIALSEQVDVLQFSKIKAYGSIPIKQTVELCDKIIKDYEHTDADKAVMSELKELALKTKEAYDDFSLALNQPNRLQKFLQRLWPEKKESSEELHLKAKTCLDFLIKLHNTLESYEQSLMKTFEYISLSGEVERDSCDAIEQYLVAGRMAEERIVQEVEQARVEWEQSGLIVAQDKYDERKDGLEAFQMVLTNLEKSRFAHALSRAQLKVELMTNKKAQICLQTQKEHSMMTAKQQIRNALFNAANRDAIEGQHSLSLLNSELMKKISSDVVCTAKEAEELIEKAIYTTEAAIEAANTVINGMGEIEAVSRNVKESTKSDIEKLRVIFDQIAPLTTGPKETTNGTSSTSTSTSKPNGLSF